MAFLNHYGMYKNNYCVQEKFMKGPHTDWVYHDLFLDDGFIHAYNHNILGLPSGYY